MSYKVVPFVAQISNKGNSSEVAAQVESRIDTYTSDGWEFVSCGNIDTVVAGTSGCFGFGATPSSLSSTMVLVFRK